MTPKHRFAALVVIGVAALAASLPGVAVAGGGTTYTVTRTDDPIPDACAPADCSLREAVLAANLTDNFDGIELSPAEYVLTITGPGDALQGDLDITHFVEIYSENGEATINGNGTVTGDRVFQIHNEETTLRNVGVTGGVAPADLDTRHRGGGIRVNAGGMLSMIDGRVANNSAPGSDPQGGGIFAAGRLSLSRTVIEGNQATGTGNAIGGFGGGIFTQEVTMSRATIADSVIRQNHATSGGGIAGTGSVTVDRSRLRDNSATGGGGIYVHGGASYILRNDNLNGNTAAQRGGAIRVVDGDVALTGSTVTENVALDAGGISAFDEFGGGPSRVTLTSTILANNIDSPTPSSFPNCWGETGGLFVSGGYNIIGNASGCGMTPGTGDQIGFAASPLDPKVGGPTFNGGPLFGHLTQSLLAGSPALNKGGPAGSTCTGLDSRGLPRSYGGRCDVGAYERAVCNGVLVNRVGTTSSDTPDVPELAPTDGADGYLGLNAGDTLKGGKGNDGICGNEDFDTLKGGAGNDKLVGGAGNDRLVGGAGRDRCIGGPGTDTATGCEVRKSLP